MLRARALALVAALAATTTSLPVHAQAQGDDDWGVKQNPFDPRIVGRWKGILEHDPSDATALKKLTDLYAKYATVEKLIAEYEGAAAKKPDSFAYQMILGHLRRSRNEVDKALAHYEKAAQLAPKDPTVHLARAELYKQRQKKAEAADAYAQALPLARNAKEKKTVLRALADLALDAGDIAKARGWYQQVIDLDPADVTARLELADALSKHNLHDEALKEYQDAVKRLSTDPARRVEVLARIGAEQESLNQEDDAIATYRQAMDLTAKGHYLRKQLTERIIDIYRKRQDLRALIAYYEKTFTGRGHFEWDVLARLYEETGEQDKALEAYKKAVAASPTELDTQRRLIALLDRAGKDEEVIRQYEAVIRIAPGEPRFQLELAERLFKRGDRTRALALLVQVAGRFPDDAGVHSALADLYSRWGQEQLALKEYEVLVRIEPNDETHLVNLGEQWFQKGEKGKAEEIWKKLAALKTPEGYARLGEVYAEHDMGSQAIDMYGKAIAIKPKDPVLWRGLAGVLERQRQDDRAIEAWEKVMEFTAGDAAQKGPRREARTRIISILNRKASNGQALKAKLPEWRRAFEGQPPDLEGGYRLAEAFLKLNRYEEAEQTLAAILKVDPKDQDAKHQLVAVLKGEHKFADAIAMLKQLAAEEPLMERQYFAEIAELELALYHDDEAIAYALKALEKSPNDPQAQERLAEIYAKREDWTKAVAAYRRAADLDPRNFKVRFALARLYARLGTSTDEKERYDREAALLYREIIKRAPDEETIRNAARKAIDIEEVLGTLGELEKEIAPLAFLFANKVTYRRILVEVYDRYVPPLVARARAGDAEAEKELVRLGEHGLKPLLEALEDTSDPAQQRVAVRVLGYLGNKNAAPPLVKLALEAGSAPATPVVTSLGAQPDSATEMDVRVEALVAAGRLGDPRIIPELVKLLGNREVALREAAAWALGQTRSPSATGALLTALGDSRFSVHALACIGLGHVGDKRALDKAAEVMKDPSRDAGARAACAYALGLARQPGYVKELGDVVAAGNDDVQVKAAWALGRIGDARALPALLRAYWQRKQAVRDAIVWAVGRIAAGGDTSALPFEDAAVEAGKIDYRALVRGLASIPDPTTRPIDPAVLRGHAADLSAGIAEALSLPGRRDVVVRVLRDLDAAEGGLALGAFTLKPMADTGLLDAVAGQIAPRVEALCDAKDGEIRQLALEVLAKMASPAAPDKLARALDDDSAQVRLTALRAAARWGALTGGAGKGSPALVAAVSKRIKAASYQERALVAETLGTLPDGQAPLMGMLEGDENGFVREAAARALARAHPPASVPILLAATNDEVAEVRLAVVQALAPHGAEAQVRTRLAELAKGDPDDRVRAAAAKNH